MSLSNMKRLQLSLLKQLDGNLLPKWLQKGSCMPQNNPVKYSTPVPKSTICQLNDDIWYRSVFNEKTTEIRSNSDT